MSKQVQVLQQLADCANFRFFRILSPVHGLAQLSDPLSDISVFVKDLEGRFMYLNASGCECCGVRRAADGLGRPPPGQKPAACTCCSAHVFISCLHRGKRNIN